MRLFVALVPPADALAHLSAAVAPVRAGHAELQWVPTERWHLTLAFYGEVPDGDLPRVRRRVTRAARGVAPLSLAFAGSGQFGDRVLWVGVTGDLDRLGEVASRAAVDGRPYRPHLTVARVRRAGSPRAAAQALSAYVGPSWRATEVRLVRSHLGPAPRHEVLDTFPLAGAG